ncbi:Uncharacterised protein [Priestia megaterium]|uniref:hypothetical protein n=1 Tax=Priestia megaterium TaxID=1404 RepID=UPI000E1B15B1|nr:hypothetical protein [Priestia megaterium]SSY69948.1 Uncharacterised protein [Priestia megaterium]
MEILDQINTSLSLVKDLSELAQGSPIIVLPILGGFTFNFNFDVNKQAEKKEKKTKKKKLS